jgi:hypothetical protein
MTRANHYNVASSDDVHAKRLQRAFPGTWKGLAMEKWLCWGSLGVSGLLLLLFLLDIFLSFPFGGMDWIVSTLGIISCGLVGYLAWEAFKDLR